MKPKKLRIPAPVHHKASGQDVVFLRDDDGKRRMVYLGEHGTTVAARRYREVLADYLAGKPIAARAKPKRRSNGPRLPSSAPRSCSTPSATT